MKIVIGLLILNIVVSTFLVYAALGNAAYQKQQEDMLCAIGNSVGAFGCVK